VCKLYVLQYYHSELFKKTVTVIYSILKVTSKDFQAIKAFTVKTHVDIFFICINKFLIVILNMEQTFILDTLYIQKLESQTFYILCVFLTNEILFTKFQNIFNFTLYSIRLDAGSFGTMGVGSGFAIAAALVEASSAEKENRPPCKVLCIQGDSAFGFSGMELEVAARYKLPIVFIIANNNGIYNGLDCEGYDSITGDANSTLLPLVVPPVSLNPKTQYEKIMQAFGCRGLEIVKPEELRRSLKEALHETHNPSLLHVRVESTSARKAQVCWQAVLFIYIYI